MMTGQQGSAIVLHPIVFRTLLCVSLTVVIIGLLLWGLRSAEAQEVPAQTPGAVAALDRPDDPVVLTGAQLSAFADAPLSELAAYASQGGVWSPIPFQLDEVSLTGTYVISDGGRLDANDELVFMARDAGESVAAADWPPDVSARLFPRIMITVTDPLSASQQAWVYVYRSTTLTRSHATYLSWTHATQTAAAISYTASFSPTKFVGLADLFINGGNVDLLDRQKTRLGTIIGSFNEEQLVSALGAATITLPATGPIRAATNVGDLKAAFYPSSMEFSVTVNSPIAVTSIRSSFDWISPTVSGIQTYYDSNTPSGVAIDGAIDAISMTPRTSWFQVNGSAAGPGGLVMAIPTLNPGGGTVTNYYVDDGAIDNSDTGDRRSYGDAGLQVSCSIFSPCAGASFKLIAYILPPGTSTNVGNVYFARATQPLQATTAAQCCAPIDGSGLRVHLPLVLSNFP
jgi:hypothetical protein